MPTWRVNDIKIGGPSQTTTLLLWNYLNTKYSVSDYTEFQNTSEVRALFSFIYTECNIEDKL